MASAFLRHTLTISEMDDMMATFMACRRDMVVKRVDEELFLAENKKRRRETAGEEAVMSKRARTTEIDLTPTGLQRVTGMNSFHIYQF